MKRQHVITLLKLLAVAAIMFGVFWNIAWADRYEVCEADGSTVRIEMTGSIEGRWDDPEDVVFLPAAEPGAPAPSRIVKRPGKQEDGTVIKVSPGLPTFLRNLYLPLFLLGALCYLLTISISATRWWWLLRVNDLRVTWWDVFRFTWIGIFFNNVVPGQTGGDVVKAIYIMKHCPGGRVRSLVSVFVDRVMGLGSLALLGGVVVLVVVLSREDPEGHFHNLAMAIWGVLGLVGLLGVIGFSKRIRRLVRLDELLNRLPGGLSRPLKNVDQAIHFYRAHGKGILVWLFAGMLNHTVMVSSVMFMGMALGMGKPGVGVPVIDYFVLVPILTIISAIPIGPNGWGVGEFAYGILFAAVCAGYLEGVTDPAFLMATQAVALSVLYRIHLTLWSLAGGILILTDRNRVTRAEFEEEIAREQGDNEQVGDVGEGVTDTDH